MLESGRAGWEKALALVVWAVSHQMLGQALISSSQLSLRAADSMLILPLVFLCHFSVQFSPQCKPRHHKKYPSSRVRSSQQVSGLEHRRERWGCDGIYDDSSARHFLREANGSTQHPSLRKCYMTVVVGMRLQARSSTPRAYLLSTHATPSYSRWIPRLVAR
jgi:hypothetical protein